MKIKHIIYILSILLFTCCVEQQVKKDILGFIDTDNGKIAKSPSLFVPEKFEAPDLLIHDKFILLPLSVKYSTLDYEAIISSTEHLKSIFGTNTQWPEGLTIEQNIKEIEIHEEYFKNKNAFAYSVFTPDKKEIIGCVYINPAYKKGYDASVIMWVRKTSFDKGLDDILYKIVSDWLINTWTFRNIGFPGRDISWEEWNKIKE